ncbi:hypothetical protein HYPSUDRAFT_203042 [Hypholoma sublateritium FD-334 SS-4]|uniref:Uncharacterized protein n=1 Tax=Hypholoma sublateritium (strain FD-334 SS-4) TaxID=945553 RepID=A0A0D2PN24_HYPSF|nr:hypothetical protein HYPSUDRAFT_203042 [Hypholoma sublateritium FD-334 SS-4]
MHFVVPYGHSLHTLSTPFKLTEDILICSYFNQNRYVSALVLSAFFAPRPRRRGGISLDRNRIGSGQIVLFAFAFPFVPAPCVPPSPEMAQRISVQDVL